MRGGRALTPYDALFLPLWGGLIGLAWLVLALWGLSPWAAYLDHDWTRLAILASLCRSLPAGEALAAAAVTALGWLVMTVAMMLPTTLPLLLAFRGMVARRHDRGRLLGLVVTGYLLIWLGFGIAAHLVGMALAGAVAASPWLTFNGWAIATGLLLAAGLFQLSSLKHRCLDGCRAPVSFVLSRWRGRRPGAESLRLGVAHGAWCVGCCWALMLLMLAVGAANLGWMLLLAAVMALEKNGRHGRRMAGPVGYALLLGAAGVAAGNLLTL
jgi:predicted metal-binding membrane protein